MFCFVIRYLDVVGYICLLQMLSGLGEDPD